jgi:hypothetical protein
MKSIVLWEDYCWWEHGRWTWSYQAHWRVLTWKPKPGSMPNRCGRPAVPWLDRLRPLLPRIGAGVCYSFGRFAWHTEHHGISLPLFSFCCFSFSPLQSSHAFWGSRGGDLVSRGASGEDHCESVPVNQHCTARWRPRQSRTTTAGRDLLHERQVLVELHGNQVISCSWKYSCRQPAGEQGRRTTSRSREYYSARAWQQPVMPLI